MEIIKIEFSNAEFSNLKNLILNFQSYYEDENEWDFKDLDDQRLIAVQIVDILSKVFSEK